MNNRSSHKPNPDVDELLRYNGTPPRPVRPAPKRIPQTADSILRDNRTMSERVTRGWVITFVFLWVGAFVAALLLR